MPDLIEYALVHGISDKSYIGWPVKGKSTFLFFPTPENFFRSNVTCLQNATFRFHQKGAIAEMDRLRKEGFELVIVSASAEN
jgi:hypothetical protein